MDETQLMWTTTVVFLRIRFFFCLTKPLTTWTIIQSSKWKTENAGSSSTTADQSPPVHQLWVSSISLQSAFSDAGTTLLAGPTLEAAALPRPSVPVPQRLQSSQPRSDLLLQRLRASLCHPTGPTFFLWLEWQRQKTKSPTWVVVPVYHLSL